MSYIVNVFLDASTLIAWMLFPDLKEPGSENLQLFLQRPASFAYTSQLCIAESLSCFKRKRSRGEISVEGYSMAIYRLSSSLRSGRLRLSTFEHLNFQVIDRANEAISDHHHEVDLIDYLQIIDVIEGEYSSFAGPSQTVLATCDKGLAKIATANKVRVWNPSSATSP